MSDKSGNTPLSQHLAGASKLPVVDSDGNHIRDQDAAELLGKQGAQASPANCIESDDMAYVYQAIQHGARMAHIAADKLANAGEGEDGARFSLLDTNFFSETTTACPGFDVTVQVFVSQRER